MYFNLGEGAPNNPPRGTYGPPTLTSILEDYEYIHRKRPTEVQVHQEASSLRLMYMNGTEQLALRTFARNRDYVCGPKNINLSKSRSGVSEHGRAATNSRFLLSKAPDGALYVMHSVETRGVGLGVVPYASATSGWYRFPFKMGN